MTPPRNAATEGFKLVGKHRAGCWGHEAGGFYSCDGHESRTKTGRKGGSTWWYRFLCQDPSCKAVALVRAYGFAAERTGRNGRTSEDVTHNIGGVHIEVKRDERLSVDAMVRQAERDAPAGLLPVVAYRRNFQPWRVVVDAEDWLRLKQIERDSLSERRAA